MRRYLSRAVALAAGLVFSMTSLGHFFVVRSIENPVTVVEAVDTESSYACVDAAGSEQARGASLDEAIAACGTLAAADGGDYRIEEVLTERTVSRTATHDIRGSTDLRVTAANAQFILVNGASGSGGASGGGSSPTLHAFTGFPLGVDGYHDLTAIYQENNALDAVRVIYLSSLNGNDGTAVTYVAGTDAPVDPWTPGSINPYLTFSAAYGQLRDGNADVLLIERGSTFTSNWQIDKGGVSASKRMIIAAYGTGARPQFIATTNQVITADDNSPRNYVIYADLELYNLVHDPDGGSYNAASTNDQVMQLQGPTLAMNDWLFENIYFRFGEVVIQNGSLSDQLHRIAFHRNFFYAAHSPTGATRSGLFIQQATDLYLSENIWDYGGWYPGSGTATSFNHNFYSQYNNLNVTTISNVSMRASSHGFHQRSAGIQTKNVLLSNPLTQFGYAGPGSGSYYPFSGESSYNLVLDSRDISGANRGTGIMYSGVDGVLIKENIVAHNVSGLASIQALVSRHTNSASVAGANLTFDGNIVYDWDNGDASASGILFSNDESIVFEGIVLTGNQVYASAGSLVDLPSAQAAAFTSTNNTFSGSNSFAPGTNFTGYDSAVAGTGDSYSASPPSYTDPDRDIVSYVTSIGESPSSYTDALDIFSAGYRANDRGNWNPAYSAKNLNNYVRAGFDLAAVD